MKINDFRTLYTMELQEAGSIGAQLAEALPKFIDIASDPTLKDTLDAELSEVRSQVDRLSALVETHGADPREHEDQSMQTILAEATKWVGMIGDPAARDAALIASIQRVKHYEIAVYGSLVAWSRQLGLDDHEALHSILEEDKRGDARLTELANGSVNVEAAA